jgi:hypothetical protein
LVLLLLLLPCLGAAVNLLLRLLLLVLLLLLLLAMPADHSAAAATLTLLLLLLAALCTSTGTEGCAKLPTQLLLRRATSSMLIKHGYTVFIKPLYSSNANNLLPSLTCSREV